MKISKKYIILILSAIFSAALSFSQEEVTSQTAEEQEIQSQEKYKILNLEFNSQGKTKVYAIKRNVTNIDYNKIFTSKEEFETYLSDIKQQLVNTRLVDNIQYSYEIAGTEDDINLAKVSYSFSDSKSFLALPKPTLDTNSGFEIKLKLKDNNFLGTMSDLNLDLNGQFGNKDAPDDWSKITGGFNFEYEFPFNIGITENSWSNTFEFNWEIGDDLPEFNYNTGLVFGIPFGDHKINLSGTQSVVREKDYIEYGDELYFIEKAEISLPLVLGYLGNTTAVTYTPSVNIVYNWDKDGINENNTDLKQSPMMNVVQSIGVSNINWTEKYNFRNGYYFSTEQGIGWDFHTEIIGEKVVPYITANARCYKSWTYLGFALNSNFFAGLNKNTKIGSYLRGAADYQKFSDDYNVDTNNYALETQCALTFNIDFPIHIITTDWIKWGEAIFGKYSEMSSVKQKIFLVPYKLFQYLNFELQISPFIDVGLLKNRASGSIFNIKEGIYTGGLEFLIYPQKWKSYVVRASIGYDLSKGILSQKTDYFDSDWRNPSRNYEFYFGLGLLF